MATSDRSPTTSTEPSLIGLFARPHEKESEIIGPRIHPEKSIVPVVTVSASDNAIKEVQGTAFFVAPKILMSAKHVLGVSPEGDAQLRAAHIFLTRRDEPVPTFAIEPIYVDPKHDIAVGRVEEWPYDEYYPLDSTNVVAMNVDVLTYEYSASQLKRNDITGRSEMELVPTFRKGHVTRKYTDDHGFQRPVECLELSYPAFKRASGAPVIVNDGSWSVIGLIVANVERQLLPAHLMRSEFPDGVVEEIKYFLPMGQAIQAIRLRATLKAAIGAWRRGDVGR